MVTFDEEDRRAIIKIHQKFAGTTEDIDLYHEVRAEGQVEVWLNLLTDEMQSTIRYECRIGA